MRAKWFHSIAVTTAQVNFYNVGLCECIVQDLLCTDNRTPALHYPLLQNGAVVGMLIKKTDEYMSKYMCAWCIGWVIQQYPKVFKPGFLWGGGQAQERGCGE